MFDKDETDLFSTDEEPDGSGGCAGDADDLPGTDHSDEGLESEGQTDPEEEQAEEDDEEQEEDAECDEFEPELKKPRHTRKPMKVEIVADPFRASASGLHGAQAKQGKRVVGFYECDICMAKFDGGED